MTEGVTSSFRSLRSQGLFQISYEDLSMEASQPWSRDTAVSSGLLLLRLRWETVSGSR